MQVCVHVVHRCTVRTLLTQPCPQIFTTSLTARALTMQSRNRTLYQNVRRMAGTEGKSQPDWWNLATTDFFTLVGPVILRAAHENGIKLSDAAIAAMVRVQSCKLLSPVACLLAGSLAMLHSLWLEPCHCAIEQHQGQRTVSRG